MCAGFLFISLPSIPHAVMKAPFPRASDMSKTLFVTCYFKSHIYKKKIDSYSRPTMSFLSPADISEIKYPGSFLLLVPRKGRNPGDSWAGGGCWLQGLLITGINGANWRSGSVLGLS